MRRPAAYYDSVIVLERSAPERTRPHSTTTLALGYLERLRLGLGSPFRLADFALADPRLDDTTRMRVAWAILARVRRGAAYGVDPSVADGFDTHAHGSAHRARIPRTTQSASGPRPR